MPDDEMIDVVDEFGRPLGAAERGTVHADGSWHVVAHVLVVARRPDGPTVVLQERAVTKSTFPGLLDLSATGHLSSGESPRDGVREVREELGIDLDPADLVPLGVRRVVDEIPGGVNRELCHVFLVADDRPLADYRPDPAEVSAVVDLRIDAALDLLAGRRAAVTGASCTGDGGAPVTREVRVEDLVPEAPLVAGPDVAPGYWTTLMVMADRFAAGLSPLAI